MISRRQVIAVGTASAVSACAPHPALSAYDRLALSLRKPLSVPPDRLDLLRYAVLAANGHNTQPWRFALSPSSVTVLPDFSRRTPAVDPDDHHLFVSLGCACENLSLAAEAYGQKATVAFQAEGGGRIRIDLSPSKPVSSDLFQAIPLRQSTRSEYAGGTVATADLKALEAAAQTEGVSLRIFTDRAKLNAVRDFVIHGNSLQMADQAFIAELRHWLRFNKAEAVTKRDGLFSGASGSPELPSWAAGMVFPLVFSEKSENDKYARQVASSSGLAVFTSDKADKEHWVRVGRSVQRFALQASVLGLKTAVINQPVEVASVRAEFAKWLGLGPGLGPGGGRPDFVLRFGYGQLLPMSLRRSVADSLVR